MTGRSYELRVNGAAREVVAEPAATLLDVLRAHLGLTGAKASCGRGECGACTVLVDGVPTLSCVTLAALVDGAVTTVEGLAEPSCDLRGAIADHGGFQCGFCTPAQVVLGHVVAGRVGERLAGATAAGPPDRSVGAGVDDELEAWARHQMSGVICRCTGGAPIVDAVLETAVARVGAHEVGAHEVGA